MIEILASSLLLSAVRRDDAATVSILLENGVDIKAVTQLNPKIIIKN
jgi:hypothetical protein